MALFTVRDGWHYEACFFAGGKNPTTGQGADWLALIWKEGPRTDPSQPWQLRYRFRYHASANPWDETDEKNVYDVKAPGNSDVETLVEATREIGSLCALRYDTTLTEWRATTGTADELMAWMQKQPWSHMARLEETN